MSLFNAKDTIVRAVKVQSGNADDLKLCDHLPMEEFEFSEKFSEAIRSGKITSVEVASNPRQKQRLVVSYRMNNNTYACNHRLLELVKLARK